MNIEPQIKTVKEKKLIGSHVVMSLAENRVGALWKNFMPQRNEIKNRFSRDLISMRVYNEDYDFQQIDLNAKFEKWATVEVSDFDNVPEGMETFILPAGLYAVFHYKGLNTDTKIFEFIFGKWIPSSNYELDTRPHFEVLGEKYKNGDPESEEEIWVPVKLQLA
ncbi:MAG: GyrI-like domain-containing protein [Bacteroidia bacterium]